MKSIIFLVHRIPYPPNKGDKIRSFNLLRFLAKSYDVYLGAFIDDASDWRHIDDVKAMCKDFCFLPLQPVRAQIRSLQGLFTGQPLTSPYYFDKRMQSWVTDVLTSHDIDTALIFSSGMAQYIENLPIPRKLIDFVDVDSDKWFQYSKNKNGFTNWVYRRESERLFELERRVANQFDRSIFVSYDEAQLFRDMVPEASDRITFVENGVDAEYFSPYHEFKTPYSDDELVLVFTGAMDYWANADAVVWFAKHVFPEILERNNRARFYIVGGKPLENVKRLKRLDGVIVTGAVNDVRPYIKYAHLSVAPLRIARGIQNKVLEAMAMAKFVIATPAAMEGIRTNPDVDVMVTDNPTTMVEKTLAGFDKHPGQLFSERNRQNVIDHYRWDQKFEDFSKILNR